MTLDTRTPTSEFLERFHNQKELLKPAYDGRYYFLAKKLMRNYYEPRGSKVLYIPTVIDGYYIGLI
jgi:hypothetical protein